MIFCWIREILGWALVVLSLYLLLVILEMFRSSPPQYLESIPLTLLAIFFFRGGVHTLRAAVAVRVALQAAQLGSQARVEKKAAPVKRRLPPILPG